MPTSSKRSMTPDNPHWQCAGGDMALCKPLITSDELKEIPLEVAVRVFQFEGDGPTAQVSNDHEHLQVFDHVAFDRLSPGQR